MLTAGLNALALVRFGGVRLIHGGGRDGLTLLLLGLGAIGAAIWAVARPGGPKETAKSERQPTA
jgi:hypothetical protein